MNDPTDVCLSLERERLLLLQTLKDAAREMDGWMRDSAPSADDIDEMRATFRRAILEAEGDAL